MVNEKPKKVVKKSAGKTVSTSRKTTAKKKSAVTKKKTTVQTKKSPVKKTATPKAKKPVAKKITKKPVEKSKPKVSAVKKTTTAKAKKPAVRKTPKRVTTDDNADLKIKKASKTQVERLENVIDKLSQSPKQRYITTVPGVLRKVPTTRKSVSVVHKELPITAILNFFKKGN